MPKDPANPLGLRGCSLAAHLAELVHDLGFGAADPREVAAAMREEPPTEPSRPRRLPDCTCSVRPKTARGQAAPPPLAP